MRTPVIAGNWKMFKTIGESTSLVNDLKTLVSGINGVEIVVAPVCTSLSRVADALAGSAIRLAAQNCYWEDEGAFTGEVSPKLLKDAGCSHVIIGHSERRQYFAETDATVNKKVNATVSCGLTAIVCVGETLEEREGGSTFAVIETQIRGAFASVPATALDQVIIAYEPVWAIGTGRTATEGQAQEVHAFLRRLVAEIYSPTVAEAIRILYGGSVKPDNIKGLMAQPDIDGALVGGASLKADSFAAIVKFES